jgi:pilus assembly protein CpaB
MNMKAVIPLGLAMVLGLVAAFLAKNAMSNRGQTQSQQGNLVSVVVAKQDIQPGGTLSKDDVTTSRVPAEAAAGQVFSDPQQLVGRVVLNALVKGQTIYETLLAPSGTGGGLQALVPPGMRAITLEVTEFSGVGGMLTPGSHVDVISVVRDDKVHESVARTILQNIKVQAVGRSLSTASSSDGDNKGAANNITLLCTPKQAQVLQLSTIASRPWFVLRSGADGKELPVEGTTMAELRGDSADQPDTETASTDTPTSPTAPDIFSPSPQPATPAVINVAPPAQPAAEAPAQPVVTRRVVQVYRGGTESQVTFVVPAQRTATADVPLTPETH